MVCVRCKMAVQSVLERLNIEYEQIELGQVKINDKLSSDQLFKLNNDLRMYELELTADKRMILVERIKTLIIDNFHSSRGAIRHKFSD